jgi:hypothetical protein
MQGADMRYLWVAVAFGWLAEGAFGIEGAAKDAAEKGAAFLRKHYADPEACGKADFKTGEVALAGLALLEAGVKPDDPALVNIIGYVRKTVAAQHETYHLACCILFFDKLGEVSNSTADRPWIQLCGVRLYAGMNIAGGWTYASWEPVGEAEAARWTAEFAKAKADGKLHPEVAKLYAGVAQAFQARGRANDVGDNSNTQFGIVGLWVASRHGLNAKDAFAAVERRYVTTWHREGGWGYKPGEPPSSMPMTCAGLVGLAVGEASRGVEPKPAKPAGGPPQDDPFFNPKKPAEVAKPAANAAKTEMIQKAILGLGQAMAVSKVPPGTDHGQATNTIQPFTGTGNVYYLLWSVERCAVAYGLDTFADVDWYAWGTHYLLSLQNKEGSWTGLVYPDTVNTSFALLFLYKANSYRDLTGRIAGRVKDPGTQELRAAPGTKPLFDPKAKPTPPVEPRKEPVAGPGGFSPNPVVPPTDEVAAAVRSLVSAKPGEWPQKLASIRDAKGSENTQILVQLAGVVEGERRKLAREALAERLTRMSPRSLQSMLESQEPELRRAAALACGMKQLEESIPWLIARLADPSESVLPAALASLKSLTGKDFGPAAGAGEEERLKAAAQWREWYRSQRK